MCEDNVAAIHDSDDGVSVGYEECAEVVGSISSVLVLVSIFTLATEACSKVEDKISKSRRLMQAWLVLTLMNGLIEIGFNVWPIGITYARRPHLNFTFFVMYLVFRIHGLVVVCLLYPRREQESSEEKKTENTSLPNRPVSVCESNITCETNITDDTGTIRYLVCSMNE